MKKFILIIVIAITITTSCCTVNAQTIDTVNVSETERIIDKYSAKFEASITALAESLKTPVEHVYSVLVTQQYVIAITWLIVLTSLLFLAIVSWLLWLKDKNDKEQWWGIPALLTLVFFVFLFIQIGTVTTGIINPEYGAIKDIINFVK